MKYTEYQQTGDVAGYGKQELRKANESLAAAKKATPVDLHDFFSGGIRWGKVGYYWYWILR